jgi:hypothetical protein
LWPLVFVLLKCEIVIVLMMDRVYITLVAMVRANGGFLVGVFWAGRHCLVLVEGGISVGVLVLKRVVNLAVCVRLLLLTI